MKLNLTTKLLAPWLISMLIISVGAGVLYLYVTSMEATNYEHNEQHRQSVYLSKDIMFLSQERWTLALQYIANRSPETAHQLEDSEKQTLARIERMKAMFQEPDIEKIHAASHQDRVVLDNYVKVRAGHSQLYTELIRAVDTGDIRLQKKKLRELTRKMQSVRASLDDLEIYHTKADEVAQRYTKAEILRIEILFLICIGGLLLIVFWFTIYQSVEVAKPLKRLTEAAIAIESGESGINQPLELARSDEIGTLNRAFTAMVMRLQNYIEKLSARQSEIMEQMAAMAHVGGWELDLITKKLSWTEETYRIHEVDSGVVPTLEQGINFYAPEGRPILQAAIENAMTDGTPWDLELPFITAKGNHLWVRALGHAQLVNGKAVRLNGSFQDITERKKMMDAVLQANADLESFSYSISHDLRTPLRAIDGFSRILLEDYNDKLDDEGRRLLGVVRTSTLRMSQLIDDILHFSRAGRAALEVSSVNMDVLIHQVLDELKSYRANREIELLIGKLPDAMGDKNLLHQVFENLLTNAIKFTQPVASAKIEVGGWQKDGETIYFVKDNGVGFDMRFASKLFGVFQRLHGINEFEGTGIGLAIAKRIVIRHGGRIWAESSLGNGATFSFALPHKERQHE